ncbi:serine O-acetyltransferase EpsC [Methylobacterium sp. SyP6R]|uniref:serine O-acetyltransferase EpsC n=1 Tax=Methylobacterium sp. SyP6R TaxID=2718876 RepID=UPI001F356824|nr:serine O-acetyltransferase EpsC [Methylobacterium sp. SyP6R]MCF4130022.1 serine O-acetyltransferase [Methylobacterium sp. SyP6R]
MQEAIIARTWETLRREARDAAEHEPFLAPVLDAHILGRPGLGEALAHLLANRLRDQLSPHEAVADLVRTCLSQAPSLLFAACQDLHAYYGRDAACTNRLHPFLFYKGFIATQGYRVMNRLWHSGSFGTARWIQNRVSEVFGVDIHPAATIGTGLIIDHGTGVVIGETAVIEDDVSIMQNVTLGGTGKDEGLRHPIIRRGVLISAGSIILGRIEIGVGAKIGAGSVVLRPVPPHRTAVGAPAALVGTPRESLPAHKMDHDFIKDM